MSIAKTLSIATIAGAAMALTAAQPTLAEDHTDGDMDYSEMTKGERQLAKMLEGRVAGEPQRCIRTGFNDNMRTIDGTAYVFGRGKTIYVQRTQRPENIDRDDILVSRRFNSSEICKLDLVNTADRSFGMYTGAVFYDDFIPYTRVD